MLLIHHRRKPTAGAENASVSGRCWTRTPAYPHGRGERCCLDDPVEVGAVHPLRCGERSTEVNQLRDLGGSSPQVRGTPFRESPVGVN